MPQFASRSLLAFIAIFTISGILAFSNKSQYVPPSVIVRQRAKEQGALFKPFTPPPVQINSSEEESIVSYPEPVSNEPGVARVEARPSPEYRPFTQEELFRIQHPQSYLNYLGTIESLMIQNGFLKPEEREVFDSEAKVLSFWRDKGFDFFKQKGIFSESDRDWLERGLEKVRSTHAEEIIPLEQYYGRRTSAPVKTQIGATPKWISALASLVSDAVGAVSVKAQGECSQEGMSAPGPGVNLWAPCCDCDVDGVPIGCTNLVCEGQAAIYDYATGICGC